MPHQAGEAIARNRITALLHEIGDEDMPVSLVHRPQRIQPIKRRAFLDIATPRLQGLIEVDIHVGTA